MLTAVVGIVGIASCLYLYSILLSIREKIEEEMMTSNSSDLGEEE
ncbi:MULTISPECIES: hypothetical protein [unclassified Calothrix]|nr:MULTISPECIES: hypothetical protein [unclassified Calothrix]